MRAAADIATEVPAEQRESILPYLKSHLFLFFSFDLINYKPSILVVDLLSTNSLQVTSQGTRYKATANCAE